MLFVYAVVLITLSLVSYGIGRAGKVRTEMILVDQSGIDKNPPVHFIDVWQNKTMNIKMGKYIITIPHLPVLFCLRHIGDIQRANQFMVQVVKNGGAKTEKESSEYLGAYVFLVKKMYALSKPFVNRRWGFKSAFYRKSFEDITWLLSYCEEILNYWKVVEKKNELLARATTLYEIGGGRFMWNSLNMDDQGTIKLKPRFGNISKLSRK